ncbi:hypothetical protein WMY93_025858 [Mugilogobius chulae]|uniref:Uncharacterized protein n=1 Tax=Mugilogobius chulae TaxID=88201 RepID=A0AAW0N2H8_9GOBI
MSLNSCFPGLLLPKLNTTQPWLNPAKCKQEEFLQFQDVCHGYEELCSRSGPWRISHTNFTLNDILAGDTPIQPVVTELEFIKYNGTYGDNILGKVDATFIDNSVSLEGKDTSKLQSSFGNLKKEELGVPQLMKDSKERLGLDMSHALVKQTMMNNKLAFGIVKERILTTQPCSVIEEVQKEGQCGGMLNLCGPKVTKISLKENASLAKDSNVTMEIPPQTTLAYSLIELEVKQDGQFTLCLMSGINGGFEEVDSKSRLVTLTAFARHDAEKVDLKQVLGELKENFDVFASLPAQTKSSLLQQITNVIGDCAAIYLLQEAVHQLCHGEASVLVEEHKQQIQDILDLVEQCSETKNAVIKALHLLLSALDEMSSESLALLRMCCSPELLPELDKLVQCLLEGGQIDLSAQSLTPLDGELFDRVQHLFRSSNVSLKKEGDSLRMEVQQEAGNLPLILCIAVRCLASLSHNQTEFYCSCL